MKVSEINPRVKYSVSVEGAEESTKELEGLLSNVGKGISLVSSLDYAWMSWTRLAKDFDIMSFLRATLSTINAIQTMTRLLKQAQVAQQALNAAQAASQLGAAGGGAGLAAGAGTAIPFLGLAVMAALGGYGLGQWIGKLLFGPKRTWPTREWIGKTRLPTEGYPGDPGQLLREEYRAVAP